MGFQSRTNEYRWPVVRADEPKGVRPVVGYVTILERTTEDGAPLGYSILFFAADGRPVNSFPVEELDLFYDAAQAALQERGLREVPHERDITGDIIRDVQEG